jgi:stage V sporulation protein G
MAAITQVSLQLRQESARVRAEGWLVLDHAWRVNGVRVVDNGSGRLLVSLPSRRDPTGRYVDLLHPVNQAARDALNAAVLAKYHALVGDGDMKA